MIARLRWYIFSFTAQSDFTVQFALAGSLVWLGSTYHFWFTRTHRHISGKPVRSRGVVHLNRSSAHSFALVLSRRDRFTRVNWYSSARTARSQWMVHHFIFAWLARSLWYVSMSMARSLLLAGSWLLFQFSPSLCSWLALLRRYTFYSMARSHTKVHPRSKWLTLCYWFITFALARSCPLVLISWYGYFAGRWS